MALTCPSSSRAWWAGTHAAAVALAGWDRATAYDGKFMRGGRVQGGTGGGSHTHTIPNHTHVANTHVSRMC